MYRSAVKHIVVKGHGNEDQCWKAFNTLGVWVQRTESKIPVFSPDIERLQVRKTGLELL